MQVTSMLNVNWHSHTHICMTQSNHKHPVFNPTWAFLFWLYVSILFDPTWAYFQPDIGVPFSLVSLLHNCDSWLCKYLIWSLQKKVQSSPVLLTGIKNIISLKTVTESPILKVLLNFDSNTSSFILTSPDHAEEFF